MHCVYENERTKHYGRRPNTTSFFRELSTTTVLRSEEPEVLVLDLFGSKKIDWDRVYKSTLSSTCFCCRFKRHIQLLKGSGGGVVQMSRWVHI